MYITGGPPFGPYVARSTGGILRGSENGLGWIEIMMIIGYINDILISTCVALFVWGSLLNIGTIYKFAGSIYKLAGSIYIYIYICRIYI